MQTHEDKDHQLADYSLARFDEGLPHRHIATQLSPEYIRRVEQAVRNVLQEDPCEPIETLQERVRKAVAECRSTIAAGAPGEQPLGEVVVGQFFLRRMPDDPHRILRISIGEGPLAPLQGPSAYLSYRGELREILDLLMRAFHALSISCMELGGPVSTMHHVDPPNGHPEEEKHGEAAGGESGQGGGAEGAGKG